MAQNAVQNPKKHAFLRICTAFCPTKHTFFPINKRKENKRKRNILPYPSFENAKEGNFMHKRRRGDEYA
ncbi:MAG: hypothetical protein IJ417_04455 [Bacteroidaceae bacterium]|nr:hypothetical protein [Bacteroidaceae bacterium]